MLRKAILISASLVAMAAAAHAARWGVSVAVAPNKTAGITPSVTFTPAALSGTLVGGRGFFTFSSSQTSVDFTVDPADGYKITNVKVGAVKKFFVPVGTTQTDPVYNVNDPKTVTIDKPATLPTRPNASRVVVASATAAPLRYNVTTNYPRLPADEGLKVNGSLPFRMSAGYKNVVYGTAGKKIRITPGRGFKITSINVTGTSYTAVTKTGAPVTGGTGGDGIVPVAAPKNEYIELTLGPITQHVNISATAEFQYWVSPVISCTTPTVNLPYFADPAKAVVLSGTKSTSSTKAATYDWTVSTNPGGAGSVALRTYQGSTNPKIAYFRATADGTYVVTLTMTDGAVTAPAANYTIVVNKVVTEAKCTSCHTAKRDPIGGAPINYTVTMSAHYQGMSSATVPKANVCSNCHNNHDASFETLVAQPTVVNSCYVCHNPSTQATGFFASRHWQNHLETGPEFQNQLETTVTGGTVTTGGAIDGVLNANDSYQTLEDGGLVTCAYRCHFRPGMGQYSSAYSGSTRVLANGRSTTYLTYTDSLNSKTYSRPGGDSCMACHNPHGLTATYQTCLTCHTGSKHGKVPNEFWGSAHWQNHLETGSEFTEATDYTVTAGNVKNLGTTTAGYLNANDSYTTKENGSVVTCAYRCHFRPGMGPSQNVGTYLTDGHSTSSIEYIDTLNNKTYTRPGGNACMACHDAHGLESTYQTCLMCHTAFRNPGTNNALKASGHGVVPYEFFNSPHWKSTPEFGPEFANQAQVTADGANVQLGAAVDGRLDANDSYTTTEDGANVTCAYRCHFRPGMYPSSVTPPSAYVNPITKKAITYVRYSSTYDGAKYYRPGGNACMACHDPHGLEATARSTCYTCHTGSKHGWSVKAFEKSSHFTGTYAIYDGLGGPTGEACTGCHDAHSTEATFGVYSTLTLVAATGCQKCHTPGASYGIYNIDQTLKTPHGGGLPSTGSYVDGTQRTQYVSQGALCSDCHAHNNTINAGFAEGGHGHVSDVALNPWTHYDWSARTNNGTRQAGNCDRCHTAGGFVLFLGNDSATATRLAPKPGIQNVLICTGCHKYLEGESKPMPGLRTDAVVAGTTLSNGYFALFSSNVATLGAGNTKIQVQFPGYKYSSICIPCHSGRTTDAYINAKLATVANYSTLNNSDYQHAKNIGQTFISKGAYDFSGKLATFDASAHSSVKMGSADTFGPCVGCHHSDTTKTHSLEVNAASTTCTACHNAAPDMVTSKAAYDAGVLALDILIRDKFAPLLASGDSNLATERGGYWRYGRFGKAEGVPADRATAQKAYGAWYNWQILALYDNAAWAHNPAYARQILVDTIDYLDDTVMNDSSSATIAALVGTGGFTSANATSAGNFMSGASTEGCIDCHDTAVSNASNPDIENNGVRAIMPEFTTKRSHHITGGTPSDEQCVVCHLEGSAAKPTTPSARHMNGQIDLRDADTNDAYVWTGSEHTAMDDFCMSCHDSNGATFTGRAALIPASTASNPFGDTLTNSYDQVARTGVVDVKTPFDPSNASHHAVSGQKYQYRFSNRTNADAWKARNSSPRVILDDELADGKSVGGSTVDFAGHYDPAGAHEGGEATLYEADKFVATYIPLGASENVGDNSTLHCGDCHTVGQWKAASSTNADGSTTSAVIGAHGSANDYMLRNSLGTDALHSGQTYVCFNCHKGGQLEPFATHGQVVALTDTTWEEFIAEGLFASTRPKPTWNAGWNRVHPNVIAAQVSGYATAHAVSAFHAQCQADSADQVGSSNSVKSRVFYNLNGHKDRDLDYLPAANATAALPTAGAEGGNVTGIACTNCHNVGRTGWGGIHGGNNTYTDGLGRAQTTYRFMPGMGNYRYAPPGGWDGKTESDSRLIVQAQPEGSDPNLPANKMAGKMMGGCYTNKTAGENVGWSSCAHHGTSTVPFYGGGTTRTENTSTSPTWEPTVREATAGNSLVTRPLKY